MRQNGPKFCVFFAKQYTGLKKYTTAGCDGCDKYQLGNKDFISMMQILLMKPLALIHSWSLHWIDLELSGVTHRGIRNKCHFYYDLYYDCCLWWSKMTMTMKVMPIKSKIVTTRFMFTTLSSNLISQEKARADMEFVKNFTHPDFQAKSFTPQKCVICDIFFAN